MLNTIEWEHDEKYHSDVFVGDNAARWIRDYNFDKPIFLQIGFPGPHEPYDPPKRFIDMYKGAKIPDAVYSDNEFEEKPIQQYALKLHFENTPNNAVIKFDGVSDERIRQMRKHYYANVTMIDEKIGEIINALDKKGLLQNSIVIFTSDHGDCLGDHRLPYKWLMYDPMVRVPFVIKDFREKAGLSLTTIDELVSLMDIGPTILDYTQCDIPTYIEGRSLVECVAQKQLSDGAEYVFCEDNYLIMIRSQKFKMVYYIDQEYGELYDLENDKNELVNLWDKKEHQQQKCELKCRLLDWLARSNYFNGSYKLNGARQYPIRWPERDDFHYNLQAKPFTDEQRALKRP
jgi:arylsulfatase A-like enzyme